jgi:hypothetical protein
MEQWNIEMMGKEKAYKNARIGINNWNIGMMEKKEDGRME